MPIGKNAIKRVVNNGYANLKSDAPDMENSVVVESKAPAQKKSRAKNPVPKGVTSGSSSGTKNPAPKAAISIEGVVKNTVTKKAKPKTVKIIPLEDENAKVEKDLIEEKAIEQKEVKAEPKEVKAEAVEALEPAPKASMESEPDFNPVSTAEKLSDKESAVGYTNIGREIPVYLL